MKLAGKSSQTAASIAVGLTISYHIKFLRIHVLKGQKLLATSLRGTPLRASDWFQLPPLGSKKPRTLLVAVFSRNILRVAGWFPKLLGGAGDKTFQCLPRGKRQGSEWDEWVADGKKSPFLGPYAPAPSGQFESAQCGRSLLPCRNIRIYYCTGSHIPSQNVLGPSWHLHFSVPPSNHPVRWEGMWIQPPPLHVCHIMPYMIYI